MAQFYSDNRHTISLALIPLNEPLDLFCNYISDTNITIIKMCLGLYSIKHMVEDLSNCERENCFHHYMATLCDYQQRIRLYAPSNRQDSTYGGLCYTSRGVRAAMRNSSLRPAQSYISLQIQIVHQ